jgi:hypothetical protein
LALLAPLELASDTEISKNSSIVTHLAAAFTDVDAIRCFKKSL